ncbi:MAG: M48 family metalloprotease [Candidatus Eremiobacteraeota bacterium]|nr:M48 family metalloprotease [Candidatus Eremiobacteraeota bacterium]MBV8369956.1 M48 family metalloprotease [Candidatus Eremiobacteraeota bacterium]
MQRTAFIRSLIATAGVAELANIAPASALDEPSVGREVFAQLRDDGELLFDSPYYEHLNEVGSVIAQAVVSRYPYPIRYYIVRGDSANAFSVPGGNIYVNEPLLRLAKNRDELAGVLAHETGHMVLHHVAQRMASLQKKSTAASVVSVLSQIVLGPLAGAAVDYGSQAAVASSDAKASMHIEAQADEEGARIMAATGQFNPWGMVWFFQIMTETYGAGQASWLRDHPLDDARIADLEREFRANPDVFGKYKNTQQKDVAYW